MTADKLLVIIPYSLRSCFAPTNIFALRQMHPHYGSIVSLVEMLLVLLSSYHVFGFVQSSVGKMLLILVNGFYLIGSVSFYVRSLISSAVERPR
jgi:hypothetical protein